MAIFLVDEHASAKLDQFGYSSDTALSRLDVGTGDGSGTGYVIASGSQSG